MASPKSIRELRYLAGTTFNKTYVDADAAGWAAGTAVKLRPTAFDASGLQYASVMDPTLQQRVYSHPAPIPTIRRGTFSFSTFLGAGTADTTTGPVPLLLSKVLGGVAAPSARTYAVSDASGTSTTTKIYAVGIEAEAVGAAVLISGEVRSIVASGTNYVDLNMALSATPSNATTIVISTTVYPDADATQSYLDFLAIGHATADQRQMIGCQATGVALAGNAPGELPTLNWSMGVADWQWVPSGNRDALEPTSASQGADPPVNLGLGGLFIQDNGTTTRTVYKGSDFAMPNLGVTYAEVPDYNGVNGLGGWQKVPGEITASLKLLHDEDMDGLYTDHTAGTAKQMIYQMGSTAQACCAIEFPRCYLAADPKESDIGGLSAVELSLVADESSITTNDLTLAAFRVHYF